ncbi:MAG: hypothetical protein Tsb0018_02100 [Opitutales bacterium]|tara:strand:- start:460 stop:2265 length:1806 start_codon:yes stop_codon:yes gene_type:complete
MKRSELIHLVRAKFPPLSLSHWHDWLRWRFSDGERFLILCMIAGTACGLAAVSFHLSLHYIFYFIWDFMLGLDPLYFVIFMPLVPALGGLIAGIILTTLAPNAAGSGIPQTKVAYYRDFGMISLREGIYRFLLGCIFVGSGNSLGREGPTVHMCAAIASSLGRFFGLAKQRVRAMVPVGMGAGIAAAFNAPISAITFVFEELLEDFNSRALGGILMAVVVAAVVERSLLGEHPTFIIGAMPESGLWMLVCIPLGLAAGLLGHFFVIGLLDMRHFFKDRLPIPAWMKPGLGGLAVGIIATAVFLLTQENGVFSIGYGNVDLALGAKLTGMTMLYLFVGKFIATIFAYAAGGSGGLFSPALFFGGMVGGVFGVLLKLIFATPDTVVAACALLGMGAFFASIIRCPLTSIFIIFEMTLNYSLILPLMVGNMIAYFLAARLKPVSIYNALLLQDKINLRSLPSYRGPQDYRNLPVSAIMTYDTLNLYAYMSAGENLEQMGERRHRAYPVLNENGGFLTMLTHPELELLAKNHPKEPISDLIATDKDVESVHPETSIQHAARIFVDKELLYAPVLSKLDARRLLGIVTLHDITRQHCLVEDSVDNA